MKKTLLIVILICSFTLVSGQKSIDRLFEKYAGREGFVTVTINGDLLRLFTSNDHDCQMPATVSQIRILVQENDSVDAENFYDMVIGDVNLSLYEEFMRVKESDQDLRMLVRSEGNKFKEFLLIAGGEDNALIQVKGSMTFREAKKFSEDAKKNHGVNIVASCR